MNNSSKINKLLKKYAESIPANGMHIGYLDKAAELSDLYGEVLLQEEEQTPGREEKIEEIEKKIEILVNDTVSSGDYDRMT